MKPSINSRRSCSLASTASLVAAILLFAINDSGEIVGWSSSNPNANSHGFLYLSGSMYDLNSLLVNPSGLTIFDATAVNDNGLIAAEAVLSNGNQIAVLLTPVPEPSALAMLGIALPALARSCRSRQKIRPSPIQSNSK
jgi:probable HAF family extracellular repeat protein